MSKIKLIINYEHVARVLKAKRELCVGEAVRKAGSVPVRHGEREAKAA